LPKYPFVDEAKKGDGNGEEVKKDGGDAEKK